MDLGVFMKKLSLFVIGLLFCVSSLFAQPVLKSSSSVNEYSLVYELYGGTNAAANKDSYLENATVILAAPSRSGYKFDGWYWDDGLKNPVEDNTFTDKKGALKVYAKWIKQIDLSDFEKENMIEIIPADNKVTLENFANTEGPQDIFAYAMGKYEVTQELYMAVTGTNPSIDKGEKLPVNRVTWYDAVYFCNELTKVTMGEEECCYSISYIEKNEEGNITWAEVSWDQNKKGYRLPTEAEWEMAARGGVQGGWDYEYSGSDDINVVAWYNGNTYENKRESNVAKIVGLKKANKAGLYDMSGNVWEWCWDAMNEWSYSRINRGGGYYSYSDYCTVIYRAYYDAYERYNTLGFRVCRSL